jgi:serine/threonine protein kinase
MRMSQPDPNAAPVPTGTRPKAISAPDLLANRFRSLFLVGRGGMGSVEVALEQGEGGYERIVALKRMLPEGMGDRRLVEMFLREARLATLLKHPNVVHAFAFGENKGELFLTMEYVEGEPLSRVLTAAFEREGQLAAPIVAHILAEICDGLHAAHELKDEDGKPLNVVHRDISPHNIMVSYDGQVKLLDFGVAKMDAIDAGGRTKTGEVKGKTAYMSPEQAMGETIDRRSDIYSLGSVLFECVAGRKMWGTGTDMDMLRKLALEEPPSLAEVPGAPPPLVALHGRLVIRDPSYRLSTAREVADALRAFIAGSGTKPDPRVVRAVMGRLFATEIVRRRRSLTDALNEVAPAEAQELRASFAALPASESSTTLAETHSGLVAGVPRKGRTGRVASAIVVAVGIGLGLVAFLRRGAMTAPAATTPATTMATTTLPTTTTVASSMLASPTVDSPSAPAPATKTSVPVAASTTTFATTGGGESAGPASTANATKRAKGAKLGGPKVDKPADPPYVDPHPF